MGPDWASIGSGSRRTLGAGFDQAVLRPAARAAAGPPLDCAADAMSRLPACPIQPPRRPFYTALNAVRQGLGCYSRGPRLPITCDMSVMFFVQAQRLVEFAAAALLAMVLAARFLLR
jgi:hypothetical protein